MKLTNWTSASGKTKYWGIAFPDGHIMQMSSKKQALLNIEYLADINKINNQDNDQSTVIQSDPRESIQQPDPSVNAKADNSSNPCNNITKRSYFACIDVDSEGTRTAMGDRCDEEKRLSQSKLVSRAKNKKSSVPFPHRIRTLSSSIADGVDQLADANFQLAGIAEAAISIAECLNGTYVGESNRRDSDGANRTSQIEPETIDVDVIE